MNWKRLFRLTLFIALIFPAGCSNKDEIGNGHRVKGFIMSGEPGNASPIENAHVYIENVYVEEVYVETHTNSSGYFVLPFTSELEEDMEDFLPEYWLSDYKLIVEDEENKYYKRTLSIPQMSQNVKEHDYGIIYLQSKK